MRKLTYEEFSKRFNEVQRGKLELIPETELDYKDTRSIIRVRCPEHGIIKGSASGYLRGRRCKKCSDENQKLSYEEFSKKFNEVQKGRLELIPETKLDYSGTRSIIRVKCPIHDIIKGYVSDYLQGHGCKECADESQRLSYEAFSKRFNKIWKGKLELIPETKLDYKNTKSIIRVKCLVHDIIKGSVFGYLRGYGCPICQQGDMEKLVRELLEANNIKFEQFYRGFDWLRLNPKSKQHLDFWLPDYNIAIEVQDAPDHLYDELYIKRDKNKLKLCKKHGVTLIYFSTANFNFPYPVIKDTKTLIDEIKRIGVTNQS